MEKSRTNSSEEVTVCVCYQPPGGVCKTRKRNASHFAAGVGPGGVCKTRKRNASNPQLFPSWTDSFFRGGIYVRALKKHSPRFFNLLDGKGLFLKSVFSPG